ncbi:MAG: cob(I)yrinic acid a,c-diamide adenosyltransferase [Acidimicrobiaceae bacterium]|nr:cob(I)yrinic acid a,c-diamide adenosyltransferase [Acidimicrobiaceae bacterium]
MKIYTKKGDDGSTGLLYGGRTLKNSYAIELNGAVDEAQSAIGLVRAEATDEIAQICLGIEKDLWLLMAEVATLPENRRKLESSGSMVKASMISSLEEMIDAFEGRFEMPKEFVIPGQNRISALLDVARTTVRRAERYSVDFTQAIPDTLVGAYLNRLSDLLWMLARFAEGDHLLSKRVE